MGPKAQMLNGSPRSRPRSPKPACARTRGLVLGVRWSARHGGTHCPKSAAHAGPSAANTACNSATWLSVSAVCVTWAASASSRMAESHPLDRPGTVSERPSRPPGVARAVRTALALHQTSQRRLALLKEPRHGGRQRPRSHDQGHLEPTRKGCKSDVEGLRRHGQSFRGCSAGRRAAMWNKTSYAPVGRLDTRRGTLAGRLAVAYPPRPQSHSG